MGKSSEEIVDKENNVSEYSSSEKNSKMDEDDNYKLPEMFDDPKIKELRDLLEENKDIIKSYELSDQNLKNLRNIRKYFYLLQRRY
jgi:hypothetical protein